MSERLEIEVHLESQQAIERLNQINAALDKLRESARVADAAVGGAERTIEELSGAAGTAASSIRKVDEAAVDAAGSIKETGDASATTERKLNDLKTTGTANLRQVETKTKDVKSASVELSHFIGNTATGLIGSYLGLQSVYIVLDELKRRTESLIETRARLVEGSLGLERNLESMTFNLFGAVTPGTLQKTRDVAEAFTRHPSSRAADMGTIQAVSGAMASFKYDVTQPGSDFDIAADVMGFAQRMQFDKDAAGNMAKLLSARMIRERGAALEVMAEFQKAAQSSGVEDPREYVTNALRAVLPLVNRNVEFRDALAVFAAAAETEPSARVSAENVDVFRRVFEGKDEQSQAQLARRGLSQGLLSEKAFTPFQQKLLSQMAPDAEKDIARLTQELSDIESDVRDAQAKRAEEIELDKERSSRKPRDRAAQATIAERERAHDRRMRELGQRHEQAQQRIIDLREKLLTKAGDAALAEFYRDLPLAERLDAFRVMGTGAASAGQLGEFLFQIGATSEESKIVTNMLTGGGAEAFARVRSETEGADPMSVIDENIKYQFTNPAQSEAAKTRMMLDEAKAVGAPEHEASRFARQVRSQVDIHEVTKGGTPSMLRGSSYATREGFVTHVMREQAIERIWHFYRQMSDEERAGHPIIADLLKKLISFRQGYGFTLNFTSKNQQEIVAAVYRDFIREAQRIINDRAANPMSPRTMSEARLLDSQGQLYDSSNPRGFRLGSEVYDWSREMQPIAPLQFLPTETQEVPGPQSRAPSDAIPGSELASLDTSSLAMIELIQQDQREFHKAQRAQRAEQRIAAIREREKRLEPIRREMARRLPYLSRLSESDRMRGFMSSAELDAADAVSASGRSYYAPYEAGDRSGIFMGAEGREWFGRESPPPGTISVDGAAYEPPAPPPAGTISLDGQPYHRVTNNYYNVSYGNAFIGPNGDLDLPGRLEGIA